MPTTRSSDRQALLHRALADPSRVKILDALEQAGEGRDASELALAVGLHVNTVRSHLRQLESAGLVRPRRDAQGKPGRPHIVFDATSRSGGGPSELDPYRLLANVLAESVASEGKGPDDLTESAAYAAGRELAVDGEAEAGSLGYVTRFLARLGFEPLLRTPRGAPAEIVMRACPFEDMDPHALDIACSVHRGLIRGALGRADGDASTAVELQPEPGSCVARLSAAS